MKCHQVFLWCECLSTSVTSSGTFLSFSSQALSSFISLRLFTLSSIGGISSLSNSSHVNIAMVSSFCNYISIDLNFTCIVITFHFLATLSTLWANFFIQWPIFVKSHMGLSVGWGVNTSTCLVSLHELNHMCVVTNFQKTLNEAMCLVPNMMQICYLHSDLWMEVIAVCALCSCS